MRMINGAKHPYRKGSNWLLGMKGWVVEKRSHLTALSVFVPVFLISRGGGGRGIKDGI